MPLQRREFLKRGVGLVAASMVVPAFLAETARVLQGGAPALAAPLAAASVLGTSEMRALADAAGGAGTGAVVRLGASWWSCCWRVATTASTPLIPYGDPLYYQARPDAGDPTRAGAAPGRSGGLEPGAAEPEGALRRRPGGRGAGRGLPEPEPLALPRDGHLADGRPRAHRADGLARAIPAELCSCGTDKHLEGVVDGADGAEVVLDRVDAGAGHLEPRGVPVRRRPREPAGAQRTRFEALRARADASRAAARRRSSCGRRPRSRWTTPTCWHRWPRATRHPSPILRVRSARA